MENISNFVENFSHWLNILISQNVQMVNWCFILRNSSSLCYLFKLTVCIIQVLSFSQLLKIECFFWPIDAFSSFFAYLVIQQTMKNNSKQSANSLEHLMNQ